MTVRPHHIIWDWNGTLLDDAQACVDAINVLLRRRQRPAVSREQYLEVFDFPIRDYYLKVGFDLEQEDWSRLTQEYHAIYADLSSGTPLRPHTRRILDGLRQRGDTLSILSACELALLKRMMAERGIIDCFTHIFGRTDFQADSKVELGHALVGESGLTPDCAVLVGDTTHDFEVARAMGIACVLMTGGHQSESRLRRCGCPVVHTLHEAVAWVEGQRPDCA